MRLPEDRPDIVNLFIVYCYTGDYQYRLPQFVARNEIDIDPAINAEVVSVHLAIQDARGLNRATNSETNSVQEKARGEAHLHLCALADKLEIEPLKDLTAENFLKEAMTAKRTDWVVQSLGTLLKEMPLCDDRSLTKVVMEKFLDNWDNVARDVQRYLEIVNPLACMYAERCIEAPMLRDLGGCP